MNGARLRAALRLALVLALPLACGCSDASDDEPADGATRDAGASDASTNAGGRDAAAPVRDAATVSTGGKTGSVADAGKSRDAGTDSAITNAALCPELGWCELSDTHLETVCPDPATYPEIQANEGCGGVINDWGGGIADEKRNRLLIWGGGHRGYFGNEVYALDLSKVAMQRLNDPSDISSVDLDECASPEAYADGRPSSRHTYDGLSYLPDADKMFSLGGAGIPCGYAVTGTWTLDLATVGTAPLGQAAPWTDMDPDPYPTKATYGVVADYDPNSKRIVVDDTYSLWSYDVASNAYALLNDSDQTGAHIDYHMTGRIDPKRKLFVIVGGSGQSGGGMQVFDIASGSDHAQQDWTDQVTGCAGLLAANSPGFAYDPVQDRMIGWAGGDTVYVFDPDTKTCTTAPYAGGPGDQNENGTFGRFRYFPALNVFAVVNDYRKNAFTLRLTK